MLSSLLAIFVSCIKGLKERRLKWISGFENDLRCALEGFMCWTGRRKALEGDQTAKVNALLKA
jgi:hypothetical protein